MNFIYHYYAFRMTADHRTNMDGVALLEKKVASIEDFDRVKALVANHFKVPVEGLTIASLSYLGPADQEGQ